MLSKDLTIIIVNWNTRELLLNCLRSVYSCIEKLNFEVVVVDNASTDGSADAVRQHFPQVKLIVNRQNKGFARANNQVLPHVSSSYTLLLNSDTKIINGAIEALVTFMDNHPTAGIAAPQYLNQNGSKQNSFENFPGLISELLNKSLLKILFPQRYPSKRKNFRFPFEVDSVIGACMLVRTEAMKKVGYLDEDYFFFLEETDWCYRMWREGYSVFHVPMARIYHFQGASKKKVPVRARIEYYRSSYLFFEKNRNCFSWLFFRLFRPIKLCINFLLTSLGVALTVGKSHHLKQRWAVYFRLCLWHIYLCPVDMGLQVKQ
jgi:GT2 family glycosyltransferase